MIIQKRENSNLIPTPALPGSGAPDKSGWV